MDANPAMALWGLAQMFLGVDWDSAYKEIKSKTMSTRVQHTLESRNYLTMTPCLLHQKSAGGCIQNFFRHSSDSFRTHGQLGAKCFAVLELLKSSKSSRAKIRGIQLLGEGQSTPFTQPNERVA